MAWAISHIYKFMRRINPLIESRGIGDTDKEKIMNALSAIDSILGIMDMEISEEDMEIDRLVEERDMARKAKVEENAGKILSGFFGKEITIKFTKLAGGARRAHPFANAYWGFDADIDCEVTVDGEKFVLEGLSHKVIPDAVTNKKAELSLPITVAAAVAQELMYVGCCTIDAVVPAVVAAAMGKYTWKDAGKKAEKAAKITCSIPGAKDTAREVGRLALRIMKDLE